jgi:hypothetical protein
MANTTKPKQACVRCKAQGQGANKCRESKKHDLTTHPGTTLPGPMCKALLEFRGKEYPQPDLTADQGFLEQDLAEGGSDTADSALSKLKEDAARGVAQPEVPADPKAIGAAGEDTEWEEQLTPFAEQIPGMPQYEFRARRPTSEEAEILLDGDDFFRGVLTSQDVAAKRLTTSHSTLSREKGAVNCTESMCPELKDWLICDRMGSWRCEDDGCPGQHNCAAGRLCDASDCPLQHASEERRWMVFANKTQCWPEPMSLDEAFHCELKHLQKALTAGEEGCTRADIWRASTEVMVYGRRALAISAPFAPAAPADIVAASQPQPPVEPAAAATTAGGPPIVSALGGQAAPDGVTTASAIQVADDAVANLPPRKRQAAAAALAITEGPNKRATMTTQAVAGPPAHGYTEPTLLTSDGPLDSLGFLEGARVWASADLTESVKELVERAAELTPAGRSALLASVAHMIQQDQSKALTMLNHSLLVGQYFADQRPK